jgi:hypothetical protein
MAIALILGQLLGTLDSLSEDENHDDEQDQAKPATGIIAPTRAIRPSWQSTEEKQDQEDEQDRSNHGSDLAALHISLAVLDTK